MKIYLAGPKGEWRDKVCQALSNFQCYDPFKKSNQISISKFTQDDLEAVDNSDLLLAVINYSPFAGVCVEAGYATAKGKKIILVWLLETEIPGMLVGISERVFVSLDSAIEWLRRQS